MASFVSFVLIYLLGGLTFLPLLVVAVLIHAHLSFPVRDSSTNGSSTHEADAILRPGDDEPAIKVGDAGLADKLTRRPSGDTDVAAGYFAVCREYVPGGIKGKPPERTTPTGSTVVTSPSPSVYQSMYRSIFDRKPVSSPFDNKSAGKPPRKGGNVFYVVLRHGHLMLYDDEEMVEVRYVISVAHHKVTLYSGGEDIPEGELFIKRNAICLSSSLESVEAMVEGSVPRPFYFFSENCSEKEDFYFALLRNQEKKPESLENPPSPLPYEIPHIIALVQRLHSSEEHLQTRWINALLGRVFLALYKTPDIESYVRAKITKKISRVKIPTFLSGIVLQKIDMGNGAPSITNPRLKDLNVDGECVVEMDIRYTGNFHIEAATTARIELGARFKPRDINLVLAVVLKKLEGHLLVRIKPPPSNRLWISFERPPQMELKIEPVVSSRQITYGIILRQIESRIKEVVAETLVLPNWDDTPFFNTEGKAWRGGIWDASDSAKPSADVKTAAAEDGDVDELQHLNGDEQTESTAESSPIDIPPLPRQSSSLFSRKSTKSSTNLSGGKSNASSSSVDIKPTSSEKPRAIRSGSFASISTPTVGTDNTHADVFKPSSPPDQSHAATAMAAISARSRTNSSSNSPLTTPSASFSPPKGDNFPDLMVKEQKSDENTPTKTGSVSSASSGNSAHGDEASLEEGPAYGPSSSYHTTPGGSVPSSPASTSIASHLSELTKSHGSDSRRESTTSSISTKSGGSTDKRISLTAMTNAAISAKNWGLGALARQSGSGKASSTGHNLNEPMGRGQPLPPPGMPLPRPDRKTKTAPIPVPKRKPLPPPLLPQRSEAKNENPVEKSASPATLGRPVPPPPLPKRPQPVHVPSGHGVNDGMLVVAAPADSEPTTPREERTAPVYEQPWVGDEGEEKETVSSHLDMADDSTFAFEAPEAPETPSKRSNTRLSESPEEEYRRIPTWMAAQEEEARTRSVWVDDETGAS